MKEYSQLPLSQRYEIGALKKPVIANSASLKSWKRTPRRFRGSCAATKVATDMIPAPLMSRRNRDTSINAGRINERDTGVVSLRVNCACNGVPSRSADGCFASIIFRFRMSVFINIFAPTGPPPARCIPIYVFDLTPADRRRRPTTKADYPTGSLLTTVRPSLRRKHALATGKAI